MTKQKYLYFQLLWCISEKDYHCDNTFIYFLKHFFCISIATIMYSNEEDQFISYNRFILNQLQANNQINHNSCSHFTFRFRACFEQGVTWHSGNYRVWIHSKNAYVRWQEHTVILKKVHFFKKYYSHHKMKEKELNW